MAHPFANYGVPIGVTATDDTGAPVAGLPVTFQLPAPGFFVVNGGGNFITVTTDAQGVAPIPYPGVTASNVLGTFTWPAVAPGATSASFTLTIAGTFPNQMTVVSGDNQAVQAGATLPQPFVVQVTDAAGAPIPYPIVFFSAGSPDVTAGTFNGATNAVVAGDASGIATSPPFVVNSVLGTNTVSAITESGLNDPVIGAFFFFTIAPPPPPPVTLSTVAGSTPQSTCLDCFFPVPIAVIARNPDGSPAPGLTVTFSGDPAIVQVPGYNGSPTLDVVTGADGIARASSQISPSGYIAFATGSTTVTASSTAATNQVVFNLSAAGTPQNRIELLFGSNQSAPAGGQFAPLVVRASDDYGPVPNAAVQFVSSQPGGAGGAAVTFNGSGVAYVPADAQGIARSPAPVANSVAGAPLVNASLQEDPLASWVPGVSFGLQTTSGNPGYGLLRPWQVPPLSIAVGSSTVIPFAMQALDASGNPVANAPVIFTTDSSCATFSGSSTVTATSDANGIATSPPLKGTHASVACATSARVQGQSRDLTMHVFDPAKVQVTLSPTHVIVHYLTGVYGVSLTFTDHGQPVHVAQVSVIAQPLHGVSYATTPAIDVFDGSLFIGFTPGRKTGPYSVLVTTIAGKKFTVSVVQSP
ncbi:MAG: hypothetical protein WA190_06485 [Usitatibacter sp.]